MSLTSEEVQHIALLARVGLTPQELERYRSQMENILEQFQVLQQVNTDGVPPTSQSVPLESVMREDEPAHSLPKEDTLANAPRHKDDYLRVKAVLE